MKTIHSILKIGLSALMLTVVVMLAGAMPSFAQTAEINCDGLPECDYIRAHHYAPYQQVYLPGLNAAYKFPPEKPGILVTGIDVPNIPCVDPATESLYIGMGYRLYFEPCGTFMTYGR
jgi:hypothetical protein